MNRSIYWGAGLFILLIGVGSFVFYSQYSELQQLKQDAAEADELLEEKNKPIADNDPPAAREGFKMVPHDDHFHEVPIDAPDVWQERTPNAVNKSLTAYKNNGEYVDIDDSVFENPEALIPKIGEILLNPEKYSVSEYDKASQEDMILIQKIGDNYYGEGDYYAKAKYRDELRKLRQKTYADELLIRNGTSREEIRAMIRGEIPPKVYPITPGGTK